MGLHTLEAIPLGCKGAPLYSLNWAGAGVPWRIASNPQAVCIKLPRLLVAFDCNQDY